MFSITKQVMKNGQRIGWECQDDGFTIYVSCMGLFGVYEFPKLLENYDVFGYSDEQISDKSGNPITSLPEMEATPDAEEEISLSAPQPEVDVCSKFKATIAHSVELNKADPADYRFHTREELVDFINCEVMKFNKQGASLNIPLNAICPQEILFDVCEIFPSDGYGEGNEFANTLLSYITNATCFASAEKYNETRVWLENKLGREIHTADEFLAAYFYWGIPGVKSTCVGASVSKDVTKRTIDGLNSKVTVGLTVLDNNGFHVSGKRYKVTDEGYKQIFDSGKVDPSASQDIQKAMKIKDKYKADIILCEKSINIIGDNLTFKYASEKDDTVITVTVDKDRLTALAFGKIIIGTSIFSIKINNFDSTTSKYFPISRINMEYFPYYNALTLMLQKAWTYGNKDVSILNSVEVYKAFGFNDFSALKILDGIIKSNYTGDGTGDTDKYILWNTNYQKYFGNNDGLLSVFGDLPQELIDDVMDIDGFAEVYEEYMNYGDLFKFVSWIVENPDIIEHHENWIESSKTYKEVSKLSAVVNMEKPTESHIIIWASAVLLALDLIEGRLNADRVAYLKHLMYKPDYFGIAIALIDYWFEKSNGNKYEVIDNINNVNDLILNNKITFLREEIRSCWNKYNIETAVSNLKLDIVESKLVSSIFFRACEVFVRPNNYGLNIPIGITGIPINMGGYEYNGFTSYTYNDEFIRNMPDLPGIDKDLVYRYNAARLIAEIAWTSKQPDWDREHFTIDGKEYSIYEEGIDIGYIDSLKMSYISLRDLLEYEVSGTISALFVYNAIIDYENLKVIPRKGTTLKQYNATLFLATDDIIEDLANRYGDEYFSQIETPIWEDTPYSYLVRDLDLVQGDIIDSCNTSMVESINLFHSLDNRKGFDKANIMIEYIKYTLALEKGNKLEIYDPTSLEYDMPGVFEFEFTTNNAYDPKGFLRPSISEVLVGSEPVFSANVDVSAFGSSSIKPLQLSELSWDDIKELVLAYTSGRLISSDDILVHGRKVYSISSRSEIDLFDTRYQRSIYKLSSGYTVINAGRLYSFKEE